MEQLERALSDTRRPSDAIVARAISYAHQDVIDLMPMLKERAREAIARAEKQLAERAAQEAASLEICCANSAAASKRPRPTSTTDSWSWQSSLRPNAASCAPTGPTGSGAWSA